MGISLVFSTISTDTNDSGFLLQLRDLHLCSGHQLAGRSSDSICVPTVYLTVFMFLICLKKDLQAVLSPSSNFSLNLFLVYLGVSLMAFLTLWRVFWFCLFGRFFGVFLCLFFN